MYPHDPRCLPSARRRSRPAAALHRLETCAAASPLSRIQPGKPAYFLNISSTSEQVSNGGGAKRVFKWVVFVAALLFFLAVIRETVDPFGDQPYLEISHGDHVHFVPKDRDPNVSISNFPSQRPEPDEMITPEGRVVERE